jgi:hypothetical protein
MITRTGPNYGNLMALAGVGLLALGGTKAAWERIAVARAAQWPVYAGTLVRVTHEVERSNSKSGVSYRYRPELHFRYRVGDTEFTGRAAWLGHHPTFKTDDDLSRFLAGYAPGDAVSVHADPADPARATLFVAADPLRGLGFVIPGAILAVTGLALRRALRRQRTGT